RKKHHTYTLITTNGPNVFESVISAIGNCVVESTKPEQTLNLPPPFAVFRDKAGNPIRKIQQYWLLHES
ncbi:MAG TPA: hypothetical protein ACQGQF_01350, partial [Xylella fastidiosa subsp. pauca]